ncbi:MAG TPA: hypothetical protein V6C72_07845, partial [Chroococcales cyanobacterium]
MTALASGGIEAGLLTLGKQLVARHELTKAEKVFHRLLLLSPDNTQYLHQEIQLLARLNKADSAVPLANRLIKMSPRDADAHRQMASLLILRKSYQASISEAKAAHELDPGDLKAQLQLTNSLWMS